MIINHENIYIPLCQKVQNISFLTLRYDIFFRRVHVDLQRLDYQVQKIFTSIEKWDLLDDHAELMI